MPSLVLEFHPEAEEDARNAREWYAERSPVAARAFLAELIGVAERVAEMPARYPAYLAGTRRCFFPQFPFSLIYRMTEARVIVIAIAHHRRRPGFWAKRK